MIGIAVMILFLLIAGETKNRVASAGLQQKLAELRAAGEPLGLADLARPPIRAENNAAFFLDRAKADVDAIYKQWEPTYQIKINEDEMDAGRLTPAMHEAIRSAFEAHPQAIGLLKRAADCTDYNPELDVTAGTDRLNQAYLEHMQDQRTVLRVLNVRALLLLSDGKPEESLNTAILMFRLCRLFDRAPTIVNYLVAIACRSVAVEAAERALRAGPLPNTAHDSLEAELALHDGVKSYQWALKTERAFGLDRFREEPAMGGLVFLSRFWPTLKTDQRAYLDFMEEQINAASLPYCDGSAGTRGLANAGTWTQLFAPPIQATYCAKCRNQAEIRCLRMLNALQRLELFSPIDEPPKLVDLGLPADATTDPFNGEPLRVKRLPAGWLIYSVGMDLKDDGGVDLDPPHNQDVGLERF
jgi:hypothetical protein